MVRRARARTYGLALIAGVLAVALSAVGLVVAFPAAANPSGPESLHGHRHARVCGKPLPKQAACHAIVDLDVSGPLTTSSATPLGYGPGDLQAAYGLPSTTAGSGHTVAIVDAYDLPTAQSDLNTYRAQFGLPAWCWLLHQGQPKRWQHAATSGRWVGARNCVGHGHGLRGLPELQDPARRGLVDQF